MKPRLAAAVLAAMVVAGCSDSPVALRPGANRDVGQESEGRGVFQRYVSVGTSVSMGWQSDGVVASGQEASWPAQLARLAGREMTQPYIDGFGCRAPFAAPLALGVRTSGESVVAPGGSLVCAPLQAGVTIPAQNVAISSATTQDALFKTPELQLDAFYSKLYPRVLPPGMTQLSAALAQNPKFVSVELGANEVLNARSGIAIEGATIFPVAVWKTLYTSLTDQLASDARRGVLVGLIDDVATFPSFRRGSEIFADAPTLLAGFNVQVGNDCDGSDNLLFVPVVVPTAVAKGLALRGAQLPAHVLSCADGGLGKQDFVLTPSEAGVVNAKMAEMDAFIAARAQQLGFAHFRLEVLYGRPGLKPVFSVMALMTTGQPYGPFVSLDGIHPSAAGHSVLAAEAARAVNLRYGLGLPESAAFLAAR